MPELPEVETVCAGLRAAKLQAPVTRVWRSPQRLRIGAYWDRKQEGYRRLLHCVADAVERRGKYILWNFRAGAQAKEPSWQLLVHLGMSGALQIHKQGDAVANHTHLKIFFEDGRRVDYVDPRRFGGLRVASAVEHRERGPLAGLGPEPLSPQFCRAALHKALGRRKAAIRDVLLDQRVVAGVGNIYAIEALYAAKISPLREACTLTLAQCGLLAKALRQALAQGIAQGGTTLRDYRGTGGQKGRNQARLLAYGRQGEPCGRCGTRLAREALGGRSAFFCPNCQL